MPEIVIPAAPQPPSPNAYDFYVKASQAIYPSKPPPGAAHSEDLVPREMRMAATPLARKEAWLARNTRALSLLRQGFRYSCRAPAGRQGFVKGRFSQQLRIRALVQVVQVKTRLYRARGQGLPAAQSALDILRLGHDIAHGGASLGQSSSVALNSLGRYELWLTLPSLNKAELAIVTKRFDDIIRQREPLSHIMREENYFTMAIYRDSWQEQHALDREISWDWPRQVYRRLKKPLRREYENATHLTTAFQQFATQPYPNKLNLSRLPGDATSLSTIENFESIRLTAARDETESALLRTALALESHRSKQGRYPATLGELMPQELSLIPRDPFKPERGLNYKQRGTKYVLYSVGPDGRDDAGKAIDNTDFKDLWIPKRLATKKSKGDFVAGTNY